MTRLVLLAALAILPGLPACSTGSVNPEPGGNLPASTGEPLLLPYAFFSETIETRLTESSGLEDPGDEEEIVFVNSGILQYDFRSKMFSDRTMYEGNASGTLKEKITQPLEVRKETDPLAAIKKEGGQETIKNTDVQSRLLNIDNTVAKSDREGLVAIDNVDGLNQTRKKQQLVRTPGSDTIRKKQTADGLKISPAESTGPSASKTVEKLGVEKEEEPESLHVKMGTDGQAVVEIKEEQHSEKDSTQPTSTIESTPMTDIRSTETLAVEEEADGLETMETREGQDSSGERTIPSVTEEEEGLRTNKEEERGSSKFDSQSPVIRKRSSRSGEQEERSRQITYEDRTKLNFRFWAERNDTLFKVIKYDKNLKHFFDEDKEEYESRLIRETSQPENVVRLIKEGPESIEPGDRIEYRFTLENNSGKGDSRLTGIDIENIVFIDYLDQGLFYDGIYEGKIISGSSTRSFNHLDAREKNELPEFTTSAEWSRGKIAWMLPGVIRPGETLVFTFTAFYFTEHGLVTAETPLTNEPNGNTPLAVLSPDDAAVRVIRRNDEENWLEVSVRTRESEHAIRGYIGTEFFDANLEDDADKERKFWECNYASQITNEIDSGLRE